MKNYNLFFTMALLIATPLPLLAQVNDNVASYTIPADALKIGPIQSRNGDQYYTYLAPNSAQSTRRAKIAIETFSHQVLIKRELLKDGALHGIQKEWYKTGVLKSESPYRNGVMDGIFKYWDEQGRLTGESKIVKGNGWLRSYNPAGELAKEEEYRDNLKNGLSMTLSGIEGSRSIIWYKSGKKITVGLSVYKNGVFRSLGVYSESGTLSGPYIQFSAEGLAPAPEWFIEGQEVTQEKYIEATKLNPTLTPYYADPNEYKKLVTPETKTLLEKYKTIPRVKIPLEFDAKGEPVLAPATPAPK